MKLARAATVALLILAVAVTPLSASFRPGVLETRFPAYGLDSGPRVVFEDTTGLVQTIAIPRWSVEYEEQTDRILVVSWLGGCADRLYWLTFSQTPTGYRIAPRTVSFGCGYMIGLGRTLVLGLRAPIDPAIVEFQETEASVR